VTLNDFKSPFCVKFYPAPVCLELCSLSFEASLVVYGVLVVNVVTQLKPKKTAAAPRGFFAAARLSCISLFWPDSRMAVLCNKLKITNNVKLMIITHHISSYDKTAKLLTGPEVSHTAVTGID